MPLKPLNHQFSTYKHVPLCFCRPLSYVILKNFVNLSKIVHYRSYFPFGCINFAP